MAEDWRKVVYVTDDANDRFGYLIVGPGCMPIEYLEHLEEAATAWAACKTVGDVRRLPEHLGLWQLTGDFDPNGEVHGLPSELAEALGVDPDEVCGADLPDETVLWDGWDESAFEGDYPLRSHLPWEHDSPFDYAKWMPESVLSLAEPGELTSPMQETARWSFENVPVEHIIDAFEGAGWEVRRDDDAMRRHLVVPW